MFGDYENCLTAENFTNYGMWYVSTLYGWLAEENGDVHCNAMCAFIPHAKWTKLLIEMFVIVLYC